MNITMTPEVTNEVPEVGETRTIDFLRNKFCEAERRLTEEIAYRENRCRPIFHAGFDDGFLAASKHALSQLRKLWVKCRDKVEGKS